jgi:hypothetical protein
MASFLDKLSIPGLLAEFFHGPSMHSHFGQIFARRRLNRGLLALDGRAPENGIP